MKELDTLDISKFSTSKKIEEYVHEERSIRANIYENSESRILWLEENKEQGIKIKDILDSKDKIVLLGNPGIGKTKELENLFKNLWLEKKNTELIPFFLYIKNFRSNDNIDKLIKYKEWENFDKICFIIDGLDEIPDIQDFISELELFLERHDDRNIKVVISCRTNIYEKYLVKIEGFEYFYLENLRDKQIASILKNNFNINISYSDLNRYRVFLENPFNLSLFGKFYMENNRFPNNIAEAFELSINQELQLLNKEKFIKSDQIDLTHISKTLQKIAITNELMQKNGIEEMDLYRLLGKKEKYIIEKIFFIEKNPESTSFTFRHKNYQEFIAAQYIAELNTDKIIDFIKIEKVNKTKPALFNTISFLLNILDEPKFKTIKDWLLNNEPEILFLTEKDRLNPYTQKEIFEKYFTDITLEKTFWLGRNRRFPMNKLAEFADVEFLLDTIVKKEHFIAVYSAIDLLSYVDESEKEGDLKKIIIDLIFENREYRNDALRCFKDRDYHIKDKHLFENIVDFFKDDFDPDVNHQIVMMLSDFENVDDNFPILKNCLFKLYEISSERIKDNSIRGTSWILEKMTLRIKKKENFLTFLKILFDKNFDLNFSDFHGKDYQENLTEKILEVIKSDEKFLFDLVDNILVKDNHIFCRDNLFVKLVVEGSKKHPLFNHLLETFGISSSTNHILSLCITENGVEYFVKQYVQNKVKLNKNTKIENFRNHISHHNFEIAKLLEIEISKTGYVFDDFLATPEEFHSNGQKLKNFAQDNFEILFNREKLSNEISKVFEDNEVIEMTWDKIHEISWKWYEETGFHGLQNSVFGFIQNRLKNRTGITEQQVLNYLEREINLLYEIKNKIKNRKSEGFEIKPEHIEYIKNESLKVERDFDFKNVLTIKHDDYFTFKTHYYILKMLYFFDKEFNVGYSKEFYLKTLKYCNIHGKGEENLEYIFNKINDKEVFDKEIAQNINFEQMDYSTLTDHINYAIKNKLQDTYEKIGKFIICNKNILGNKDFLKSYTDLLSAHNQLEFLKKCCEDPNKYLCWEAVKLMQEKNIGNHFIHQLAKDYISSEDELYFSKALDLLFYFNDLDSLEIYLVFLKKFGTVASDLRDDFYINSIAKFENLEKLNLLKEIFDIIYDEKNKGSFDYHHSKANLENLIANLSTSEEGYTAIQIVLHEIKQGIKDKEGKFFYVNHLIDLSEQAYYNSLSRPLNFEEVKIFIENTKRPLQTNIIMEQFNFGEGSTFSGNQFGGKNNTQTNNLNSYAINPDVLKAEEILKEFQQLQVENEEWKNIFIEGMKDLIELKEAETEVTIQESKTTLRKWHDTVFDLGKRLNDWKNITFLGVDFVEKTPKLLNLLHHVNQILN